MDKRDEPDPVPYMVIEAVFSAEPDQSDVDDACTEADPSIVAEADPSDDWDSAADRDAAIVKDALFDTL
jgi:hypothetical protein